MDVTISSRSARVSQRLEDVTRRKVGRLDRYLDGLDHAEVVFSEEPNPRIVDSEICEVTLAGHGQHVRCKVAAPDTFTAVDRAVEKLEKQLRKAKTKRLDRHQGNGRAPAAQPAVGPADDISIVRRKRFLIEPLTPEDAVLSMEMLGHDFFFFTNADTGRAAVVYRRRAGDFGLIDEAEEGE